MPIRKFCDRLCDFGRTVWKSFYDMEFYRQVRTGPWVRGLVHFMKVSAVFALVMAAVSGPAAYVGLREISRQVTERVPENASLSLAGGQLSAALPMPFVVFGDDGEGGAGAVVLDTSVTGLDMPRDRVGEGGVLIGQEAVFFRSKSEERTYPLGEFPSFSVNRRQVTDWIARFSLPVSFGLAVGIGLMHFMAVFFGNFLFVLFGAGLACLFGRIFRIRLHYRQWLAVGFYALTLPLILSAFFDVIGWRTVPVFSVVFFMILASVMADERARGTKIPDGGSEGGKGGQGGQNGL
ncbi:DUF1189 domain-containing protein [Candidatus Uhrbacteria bacterium]|nr:DUF1189 domain-containing protein [Candidatus Uhrbacteria bacterium]